MINPALLSSKMDNWETPQAFFDRLDQIFSFQLDAAAADYNAKCGIYFDIDANGLDQDWSPYKRIWLNPPYGRGIERWMRKAYEESQRGSIVVCLVSARTDTQWWHDWVKDKALVTFVRRRLKFKNPQVCPDGKGNSVFPSALVIYGLDFDRILNFGPDAYLGRSGGGRPASAAATTKNASL
ncbi:MAG: DNA N-6-adenine-methyltransferase [Pseudomonadota bacterium]